MSTTQNLTKLNVKVLTKAQYDAITTKDPTTFYYVTDEGQVNADWNATSGVSQILNKPTIPEEYVLPTATTSTLGGVKIDGTTITINNGVISTGGGTMSAVTHDDSLSGEGTTENPLSIATVAEFITWE